MPNGLISIRHFMESNYFEAFDAGVAVSALSSTRFFLDAGGA